VACPVGFFVVILDSSVVILVPLVIPVFPLCHSRPPFRHSRESGNPGRAGSPIRSASLSVEDDKECVIPAAFSCHSRENGNPVRMDPASSAG